MTVFSNNLHLVGLVLLLLVGSALAEEEKENLEERFEREIEPIMVNYCYDCHGDGVKEGELALDDFGSISEMVADRDQWQKIRDHIDFRLMPPPDEFAPEEEERAKLVRWIDDAIFPVDPANPDPGEIALRRLNRTEYENTIRDLLGVEIDTAEILPPDDSGYGFDNIGDVLTISPVHMERYLDASRIALERALDFTPARFPEKKIRGDEFTGAGEGRGDAIYLGVTGRDEADVMLEKPGIYRVKVTAGSMLCGDEFPKLGVTIGGRELKVFEVSNPMDAPQEFAAEIQIDQAGKHMLVLEFLNNFKDPEAPEGMRDRNILVSDIVVEGPIDRSPFKKKSTHLAIVPEREIGEGNEVYFDRIVGDFLPKAFRRPVDADEASRYRYFLKLADEAGDGFDTAVRQALTAALVSPSFLFREEPVEALADGEKRALISEHALAARLSYFLWSSMPDEDLRRLADAGMLRQNLASETRRMIESPKSAALIDNFVGQWLQLRNLSTIVPRRNNYENISKRLPGDMRKETEMLVRHIITENLPVQTLLDADFTFLNERLAKHYGIDGVSGEKFRKVSIEHTSRRGILGHASFLTLTSHQQKTSPVLRGKYVLENILNTPPPPAPPNIPSLEDGKEHGGKMSMREELERHRADPACSSCHALMDPIGFGLENYDVVGRWRETENGNPIDPADTLVTGQKFGTAEEMRDIFISDYEDEFQRAFTVKLLTYGLGRGVKYYDRPAIDAIVVKGREDEGRFLSMLSGVINSVPFQYRRQ